jgi:glycosyltransferase involved in cell wall biosynthesis
MDVPDIWRASDIAILPSDSEALPTVLIEAGAAGLPTVASRVGGVQEIIVDQETGYLIPPRNPQALADALDRLLDNPQQAKRMGERACERVHRLFTLDGQVESLAALYELLI